MISIFEEKSRKQFSTLILAFFSVTLLLLISFSEIFQTSPILLNEDDFSGGPIDIKLLSRLDSVNLTNRLGTFELKRQTKTDWLLTEPRIMPAKSTTIQELIKALSSLKVIKVLKNDALNASSFSLDNPLVEIKMGTELEEKIDLKLGLINPIDNSAYITVSSSDMIFQVEAPNVRLEALELGSFIDSRIFSMNFENVVDFQIMRGKSREWIKLSHSKGVWESARFKNITPIGVKNAIGRSLNIQAHMIIDKKSEELDQIIENYLKNPLYTIKVTTDNKEVTYRVSNLVTTLPDIKIEKKMYFLMDASDRTYPYLFQKDNLDAFSINYKDLSESKLDKYFY